MDVSRINSGKMELQREPIELAAVLNSAIESVRPLIEKMGHHLTVRFSDTSIVVVADMVRLSQVFVNLLNNAAKYSENGGHIEVHVERQRSNVVVSVKDAGIGIPSEHLPRLFDLFTQVEHSLAKSQGGLGVGLALVKRLVEKHGGQVEAISEGPGKGSEFLVRLPIATLAAQLAPSATEATATKPPPLRVLIVDDNRDAADSVAMMLELEGHDVRTAYTGRAALELGNAFEPQVVLLDIGLPGLDGHEVCRQIRARAWGERSVLIALTGWGQTDDRRRSHAAGFDHHLVKPIDFDALSALLPRGATENMHPSMMSPKTSLE